MIRRAVPGLAAAVIATSAAVGCGNERPAPPDLARPADPRGFERFRSPNGDVSAPEPAYWAVSQGVAPAVVTYSSGHAALTIWAYPRVAVPKTDADLKVAKGLLLGSLRNRAKSLKLTSRRSTKVDGNPAIELEGRGKIARHPVRIRSVHVYKGKGEYVVDAYADPAEFPGANRKVFATVIEGLRVGGDPEAVQRNPKRAAPEPPPSLGGGN